MIMKPLHKKFLNDGKGKAGQDFSTKRTSKLNYFLNQALIWIFIFSILWFIINFLNINTYLKP